MKTKNIATIYAILAAALYAINVPLSKILLNYVEPTMMASFLYLGAGLGLFIYGLVEKKIGKSEKKEPLTKKELPYTVAMVVLDIVAPILLMLGISMTNSANVSLLNNFEIVVTSMIALVVFKEVISKRLWFAIALVTIAPFLGVAFSMLLLNERPSIQFYVALVIMIISTYFMVKDTIELQHTHEHEHTHTHEHSHGDMVHTHEHTHVHIHLHTHTGDSENHSHEHELSDHQHIHYA